MHIWDGLNWMELGKFERLKPILNYYEYLTRNGDNASADYVMQISNRENVAKYDAIIEEYRADIDRIIEEKDYEAVIDFHNRTVVIMFGSQAKTYLLDPKNWEPKSSNT